MSKETKEKIINALEGMKEYTIDLCSFSVEAKDKELAYEKAMKMIREEGWAEIDRIFEEGKEEF